MSFAREGAHIALCDINAEEVKKVSENIVSLGRKSLWFEVDVSNSSQVEAMVKQTAETLGRIDIVVNNAGIASPLKYFFEMTDEDWERVLKVNLYGTFNVMKKAAPIMIKQRYGRIVNISSGAAYSGSCGRSDYVASKCGIEGLTLSAAMELAQYGITVNAVRPGTTLTPLTKWRGYNFEALAKYVPRQRTGVTADIAHMVSFLVEEESDFITGQIIAVDGGSSIAGAGIIGQLAPLKQS
jgi:NAD(P)-dependent dehydrogenase (short-subunit alcohol dehydrogenase family)